MDDLDRLMNEDPLNLSAQDIDDIIAHHRRLRARRASGEKTAKPSVDISSIVTKLTGKAETKNLVKRRI